MVQKSTHIVKGIAVQTEFIHGGSFVRVSDDLFATSHWPIAKVSEGDEIAMFTKSTKADSFIVGEIVSVIELEGSNPRRYTFIFRAKPRKAVSRRVLTARGTHYYDVNEPANYL